MRGRGRGPTYRKTAFLLYTQALSDIENLPEKGYAGRSLRFDIPIRVALSILNSKLEKEFDIKISIVSLGPPKPPIHIMIWNKFFREKIESEREFIKLIKRACKSKVKGVIIECKGFYDVLKHYASSGYRVFALDSRGVPILNVGEEIAFNPTLFLLGCKHDVPKHYIELSSATRVSIGPKEYLASHAALAVLYIKNLLLKATRSQRVNQLFYPYDALRYALPSYEH